LKFVSGAQVRAQPVDHQCAPALLLPAAEDVAADAPVEQDELLVHGKGRLDLRRADARLHLSEPRPRKKHLVPPV
jgi:hypothetical protein